MAGINTRRSDAVSRDEFAQGAIVSQKNFTSSTLGTDWRALALTQLTGTPREPPSDSCEDGEAHKRFLQVH